MVCLPRRFYNKATETNEEEKNGPNNRNSKHRRHDYLIMIFDGLYRDSTRINSEDLIDEPYTESKSKTVSWMFTKMN